VLRIVDDDEKPALPEIMAAMDFSKERITGVNSNWGEVVWAIGAALFLNPNRFFDLKAKPGNARHCQKLRHMFNEVLLHMEPNDDKANLISRLAQIIANTIKKFITCTEGIKHNQTIHPCAAGSTVVASRSKKKIEGRQETESSKLAYHQINATGTLLLI
jgi:hypothetical protein